jgi:hypothetical protein
MPPERSSSARSCRCAAQSLATLRRRRNGRAPLAVPSRHAHERARGPAGRLIGVVACLGALTSCSPAVDRVAPPLPLPAVHEVAHITASSGARGAVITDRESVERFLAFLTSHNDGWRIPAGTFPTPQWTIELAGEPGALLVLWLGPNWLGGREGSGTARDNRLRDLSAKARLTLLDILGVMDPPNYALLWR